MFTFCLNNHFARCIGLALFCASSISVNAAEPLARPIFISGGNGHRLNMTILAEGYRASEQEQFFQDSTNLVSSFFSVEPFQEYQSYFNVHAVFIESDESGSDHPGYPLARDTYFNSSYDGSDRIITIPSGAAGMGKVTALLKTTVPETDLPVLLVNDLVYGGSGGSLLVVSRSASSPEIMVHEAGHTLAGLGDEYTEASHFVPPTEPPNTTRQTSRNTIKWNAWISASTPIPTPATLEYESVVGLFEGAQNNSTGWFRPKLDCGMRTLGTSFCEICREALVKSIYEKVRPIEGVTPQALTLVLRSAEPLSFQIQPLMPASRRLEVRWFLNGAPIVEATNNSLNLDSELLPKGTHLIRGELLDPTEWVRNDPRNLLKQSVTWRVEKQFPESIKPVVVISSPANRARLTQPNLMIAGIARDNIAVVLVLCQVNNGPFVPATGTTNWTFNTELPPGISQVRVKSVDSSGNESLLRTRILNYVLMSPLQLTVSGNGAVSGANNGQLLEVGRRYRLSAQPAKGELFRGWSGDIIENQPALSFAMQTDLQLHANFVPNPFIPLQGDYVGLFRNDEAVNWDSSGLVRLKLRSNGAFSGKVSTIERDYPFSGKFDADKQAAISINRNGGTPLQLEIILNEEDVQITGILREINWEASLRAERAKKIDAGWFGKRFTIALPGIVDQSFSLGDSVGSAVIGRKDLRIVGILADGARFSQAVPLLNESWPLFWRGRSGSIALGWVNMGSIETGQFSGEVDYMKKRQGTEFYPNGFTNRSNLRASHFQQPTSSVDLTTNMTGKYLVFEGGNLAESLRSEVSLDSRNQLGFSELSNVFLRLNSRTGVIQGSFLHPVTGSKALVYGALLQEQADFAGFFLGTNQSGRIVLDIIEE